ncbi:hypothetical protein [Peribacillus frigoritolerans]|nr:hypothetical protein [Peribacillus frigoritolerans]
MDEEKCVACGEVVDDGFALGRLCYFCIETAVVKIIKEEKEDNK